MFARVRRAVPVLAALLVLCAGCGDDKPDVKVGGEATQSASPSSSPTPTPTVSLPAPSDPPQASTNTSAGRIAMARWFLRAYDYANASNDMGAIKAVVSAQYGCPTCQDVAAYLARQKQKGLHLDPADFPALKVYETARIKPNVWVVTIVSRAPKRADVDASGKVVRTYPARKNLTIDVGVSWENNAYRITGFKTGTL